MKCFETPAIRLAALTAALLTTACSSAVRAQDSVLDGAFHIGLEFGELPSWGSFKPGISIGYHFTELVYVGFVYQVADSIQRNGSSFNAASVGLDGLLSSSETVGQRAYLQARIRPHRYSPYVSLGFVFNDRDTETITFDDRTRTITGNQVDGAIKIVQSRPAGLRPALGFGYSYTFDNGVELFTEWAGWWMFGAPEPELKFEAPGLAAASEAALRTRIVDEFTASPFNTYHTFQLGAGYTF